jgi:hypothetical protein
MLKSSANQVGVSLNGSEIRIKECKWMLRLDFFLWAASMGQTSE